MVVMGFNQLTVLQCIEVLVVCVFNKTNLNFLVVLKGFWYSNFSHVQGSNIYEKDVWGGSAVRIWETVTKLSDLGCCIWVAWDAIEATKLVGTSEWTWHAPDKLYEAFPA
jgi:hypothetical protein